VGFTRRWGPLVFLRGLPLTPHPHCACLSNWCRKCVSIEWLWGGEGWGGFLSGVDGYFLTLLNCMLTFLSSHLPPRIAPCFFQFPVLQAKHSTSHSSQFSQDKVPRSMALRRTTLPAPNVVLTLAVLGATCRGSTVIQSGASVLQLLVESSLRFAELIPQGQGKVPRSKV
jgi:hypothetical protein